MFDRLKRDQLYKKIKELALLKNVTRPRTGWINTIRELYGMPTSVLAKKLGFSQPRVSTAESYEVQDRVTLETLRKFAEALNCDLVYTFVPKEDPELYLEKLARQKAQKMVQQLSQTMKLEDQAIKDDELKRHYDQLVKELQENPKNLWDTP